MSYLSHIFGYWGAARHHRLFCAPARALSAGKAGQVCRRRGSNAN
jgi:hypothetical protein